MARLKVCGRELYIGDDDLGLTLLPHILVHILWIIDLIFCFISHKPIESSETETYFHVRWITL